MSIHTIVFLILVSVNFVWSSKDYELEDNYDPLIEDNHNKATYYLVNGFTKAHAPNYTNVPVDITKIIQSFTYEPYVMTAQCTLEFPNTILNEQQIAQIEESNQVYVYAIGQITPLTSIQIRDRWSVKINVDTLYNVDVRFFEACVVPFHGSSAQLCENEQNLIYNLICVGKVEIS
eukprot:581087_1